MYRYTGYILDASSKTPSSKARLEGEALSSLIRLRKEKYSDI